MSTKYHGFKQCPKCGAWRKNGIELSNHSDMCQSVCCHSCGMPRTKHGVHWCTAAEYEAMKQAQKARESPPPIVLCSSD